MRTFDTPLPIDVVLDDLARTLAGHTAAVLVAPPDDRLQRVIQ